MDGPCKYSKQELIHKGFDFTSLGEEDQCTSTQIIGRGQFVALENSECNEFDNWLQIVIQFGMSFVLAEHKRPLLTTHGQWIYSGNWVEGGSNK